MAIIYWCIRDFGAEAQAALRHRRPHHAGDLPARDGDRVLPSAPIAGQNFGARRADRVRETFVTAALHRDRRDGGDDAAVSHGAARADRAVHERSAGRRDGLGVPADHLVELRRERIHLLCSGMFQAMGNTWPALLSSATRLVTFAVPAMWMSIAAGVPAQASVVSVGGDLRACRRCSATCWCGGSCGASWCSRRGRGYFFGAGKSFITKRRFSLNSCGRSSWT